MLEPGAPDPRSPPLPCTLCRLLQRQPCHRFAAGARTLVPRFGFPRPGRCAALCTRPRGTCRSTTAKLAPVVAPRMRLRRLLPRLCQARQHMPMAPVPVTRKHQVGMLCDILPVRVRVHSRIPALALGSTDFATHLARQVG